MSGNRPRLVFTIAPPIRGRGSRGGRCRRGAGRAGRAAGQRNAAIIVPNDESGDESDNQQNDHDLDRGFPIDDGGDSESDISSIESDDRMEAQEDDVHAVLLGAEEETLIHPRVIIMYTH